MGQPNPPAPTMLLLAAFSRHEAALDWARQQTVAAWGEPLRESPPFAFRETDYYQASMGKELRKVFWLFPGRFDPARLPAVKLHTNAWEAAYAALGRHEEARPLNLDPGYLSLAKLVLASTKDYAHRIYLAAGIYAEITLYWRRHGWQAHEWTFADYRRSDYQQFFTECRELVHALAREPETA